MEIPVELAQIIINEEADQQIIVLRELNGQQRAFPIVIGLPEILAIDRRLKGIELPRPMTHDLLANVIEQMGGTILKVVINDLREHTFFAVIYIRQGNSVVAVDSRPSDAIALHAGLNVPLFVEDHVFEQLAM
ncbi:MAG TPA: bifunctional nuclease family protein [Anaerohalosphaeraceae bacterium]|nr:bifunctional nuclease family protein [Phycisphaerae bacterium]HOK94786.1 bifunctional nuclease family protein [Anaerohalosphaeraceae bacterium]HOL31116.1 bifunctional nuclease family protein [Anaerohalosphaeraceae bacterium]HOM74906.1 bifunctional nuclease family protein [Anaerohalosphaeraceae bacterium]HPC63869.1 bifunctional nuclease family protein [Anaerohalosphaeraceae bacterium]